MPTEVGIFNDPYFMVRSGASSKSCHLSLIHVVSVHGNTVYTIEIVRFFLILISVHGNTV